MNQARFTFHPDLDTFLAHDQRGAALEISFESGQTVKHLFESTGIPHTEVGELRANGQPVEMEYQVRDGDQMDILPASAENAPFISTPRFVLDSHLGRLAAYLRMLGFDALYRNDFDDEELAEISAQQNRILLTRDRRLLMRKVVRFGYCLRSLDSRRQVVEVLRRYALFEQIAPFKRCLRCNTPLEPVSKETILSQLKPLTIKYFDEFHICPACGQIYWKGSHYERMLHMIETINRTQDTNA